MSTMKCRSCHSAMVVDRCESSKHATTCWHQCPVCKQVRLTSEHGSAHLRQLAHSDDDNGYAAELESQHGTAYLVS